MSIDNFLYELENSKTLSVETIDFIQTDDEVGRLLVNHFKKNKNRDLALKLLERFSEIRNQPYPNGYDIGIEALMLSAYILGLHQNIEDCLKIWNTKTIDFDTFCGFDIQLVVFAGVTNTIDYLKTLNSNESEDALKYIEECKISGDFNGIEIYFSENQSPWFI
ncbi:MAG: hypothetical protein REI96_22085 [Flavobacterium nitrogenifigens]|uniref:hypothetical protein n=1 Tax=Flavobacterium nitrogenifigens TaxID=1617283 RepID=UPI002809563A|nr:hypothetical protein [Flavobacterium nitrogenifigens]MDQ8015152.1 hypothetical protein [Flavobacterium nitrogenifigens]